MRYESIADIYSANEKIREIFLDAVGSITPEEAAALPEGEKWSIQQIVEHVSMVDTGALRICAKLVEGAKAIGKPSDGKINITDEFSNKSGAVANVKVEAPERVHPTGTVTIPEALERMKLNRPGFKSIQADLERYDLSEPTFPHPFFGDIGAAEWLIIAGGHEMRHKQQIERVLEKVRQ